MHTQPIGLRPVFLYGKLAEGIGRELHLFFRTPADALRLIEANFPGFMTRFKQGYFHVSVRRNGREIDLSAERLDMGTGADELHIMPRLIGARKGKGGLMAILGGLIIGAAFFFSGGTLATALPGLLGSLTGATYGSIATMGLSLVMQGIGILLTPTPKAPTAAEKEASFIFDGPVNVSQQGGVVPVVYGKSLIGTTTISASISSEAALIGEGVNEALNPAATMMDSHPSDTISMSELMDRPARCVLTKIDGVAVTGTTGTRTFGDYTLSYNTLMPESLITVTRTAYSFLVGLTAFPITITHDGVEYVSTITLVYRNPREDR